MIIWLLFIAIELLRNYVLIEVMKKRPNYGHSALIRFAVGCIVLFKAHPEFDPAGDPTTIFPTAYFALAMWSSFYLSFDFFLNIMRGKPLFYQGKNSGFTDSLSKTKYCLLKAGALVILILSLILIYADRG